MNRIQVSWYLQLVSETTNKQQYDGMYCVPEMKCAMARQNFNKSRKPQNKGQQQFSFGQEMILQWHLVNKICNILKYASACGS